MDPASLPGPIARVLRAAAFLVVVWAAVLGVEIWRALEVVEAHGYRDLGFERSTWIVLSEAAVRGSAKGLELGLWVGGAALLVLVAFRVFPGLRFTPRELGVTLRRPGGVAWLWMLLGAALLGVHLHLQALKQGLWRGDVARGVGAWAVGAVVIALSAWWVRRADPDEEERPGATAGAALAGYGVALAACWVMLDRFLVHDEVAGGEWTKVAIAAAIGVAAFAAVRWRIGRSLREGARAPAFGPWRVVVALACVVIVLGKSFPMAGNTLGRPALTAGRPWNVVIIALDTVRVDQTSLLAELPSDRDTTPRLRTFAAESVNFRQAVTQAPWTMPAFGSILTGKYPHEHGAFSLAGHLRPSETTLPEVLREAGYRTHGVISHLYINAGRGFSQGYDAYDEAWVRGHHAITSHGVSDHAIAFLDGVGDEPFFLFAHYFDPHYEYRDHEEPKWAESYQGWLRHQLDFQNLQKNRQLVEEPELRFLFDLYNEELYNTDAHVGRIFDALERLGHADDTLVIVVSDHGEEFLERGNFGHTVGLTEEHVHVPLVIRAPRGPIGRTVDVPVETRAIYGTVLEALDVDFSPESRKRDLLAVVDEAADDGAVSSEHMTFTNVWLPDAMPMWGKKFQLASMRAGWMKLIRDVTRDRTFLYDLSSDPGETRDLSAERPDELQRMRATLEGWLQAQKQRGGLAETIEMDEALMAKLRALGYL